MSKPYKLGLRGKSTLVLGAFLFLSLFVSNLINYWQSRNIAEAQVIEVEQGKIDLLKHAIEGALHSHHKNLLTLRDVPPIKAILRARSNNDVDPENGDTLDQWRQRLNIIFTSFIEHHTDYQQVRYIDNSGNELVRVQLTPDNTLEVVKQADLQNKSAHLYVSETLKMKKGEAYYSDVSLNREQDLIQTPHLPVLRLATPVYLNNKASGLIVINIATDRLFSLIKSDGNGLLRSIVNNKGDYLKDDDPSKTFGWELGFDYKFQNIEPELADISKTKDQFFRRHAAHAGELDGFQKIYFSPNDPSRYWLLVLNIPKELVFAEVDATLTRSLVSSLLFGLILLLIIVIYMSKKVLTPIVKLASVTEQLRNGDLSVRIDETSAHDEFYTLYSAINAFAENQQQATSQLEKEVSIQTKRLSAVIDNIIDGIITIDKKGLIKSLNPAARELFGYQDEEVIGQNVKMLMPEPYHSEHDGYLHNHTTTGKKKIIGIGREVVGRRKDGTTFPMDLAVSKILTDGVTHFVGITRDITERKHNEQMQREFVSTVSHELRTPLTSVSGTLGLLAGGALGEVSDEARPIIKIAHKNSLNLATLIDDLLDMDKLVAGKMEFDLKYQPLMPLVEQSLSAITAYGDKYGVTFNLISSEDVQIECDAGRLTQVLNNFLSNAAKFSNPGSHVDISVTRKNSSVRVEVIDYGSGIPKKFNDRIFKKFSQADSSDTRQKGGTGLGLAISKELIEHMKGEIGFESKEGKGSCFYFEFQLKGTN